VQIVPEVLLTDPTGDDREIDFAVMVGAELWIGEAFTRPRYAEKAKKEARRLDRLSEVAELFNARGIILATAADQLVEATGNRARAAVPGPWPRLELREQAMMLRRPPKILNAG